MFGQLEVKKRYKKSTIKKLCESYGLTNVTIYYSQEEGWWIESDQFDNWISMDSKGAIMRLKEKFENSVK